MYVSEYTPLLHIPEKGNPYYNTKSVGGYSPCIVGNIPRGAKKRTGYEGLNTLPNCFSGDTKIITRMGLKTLAECEEKDIEVLNEYCEWEKATVHCYGEQELWRVQFSHNATFYATANHRWIVDKKSTYRGKKYNIRRIYTTEQLKPIKPYHIPYNHRDMHDPVYYDEDGIRHGFIFGDGSYYNGYRETEVHLCGDKQNFMRPFFEPFARGHYFERGGKVETYYGFPCEYKEFPSLDKPAPYLMGFFIGLMASDGCVGKGCCNISTANYETAQKIVDLCAALKIKVSKLIKQVVAEKHCMGRIYKNYTMYVVSLAINSISPEMLLNPKFKLYYCSTSRKARPYTFPRCIEPIGKIDKVYCVEAPQTHTFTLEHNILTMNCTAIATGRFNEIGGYGYIKYFNYPYYARDFVKAARQQGLEVTQKPTLGGILVWGGGKSGDGHVAPVEILYDDGSILTAESEWNGLPFRNYHRYIGNGNWRQGCYWMNSSYNYLGCVKNPAVKEDDIVTYEQWKEFMKQYEAERAQEPASNYAKASLEWVEQNGIMLGSNGEMMPKSPVTREQLATVLNRYNDACGDPLGETLITDDF